MGRLSLQKLGMQSVPCIVADDLTPEQVKAFRLADNKTAEFAAWDSELLLYELDGIFDIDMEAFGFDFNNEEVEEECEDEFQFEIPKEPKTKIGDIYRLGRHLLMCGDSTKIEDVRKLVGDGLIDLLITDPPYNVDYEGGTKEKLKMQNDKMDDEAFRSFLREAFSCADSVMKPGAAFYIWHADLEGYNFRGACYDIGWKVRQCIIWVKNTITLGRQDYQSKHEPCLYGWKGGAKHLWNSDRKQTTVLEFDKPIKNTLHPTMKPVSLFDYQIKNSTRDGDKVLDLFAGGGTTIMACERNGRCAYAMELDPKYVDVTIKRWEEFTGKKATKEND